MNKRKNYQFGLFAEKIAAIFLMLKGYKILKRRYRSHFGEIDLIAKKSNIVVFIEVKARKNPKNLEEVISDHQTFRIHASAEFFISKNPKLQNCDLRFDFIEVNKNLLPRHHPNFLS